MNATQTVEMTERMKKIKDVADALPMPTPKDAWGSNQEAARELFEELAPLTFEEFLFFHDNLKTKAGHKALGALYSRWAKTLTFTRG